MSPRDQERMFPKDYACELLSIARGDLGSTRVLLRGFEAGEGRPENVFYSAQQVIEKCLKAVLCARGVPVPLVHDLGVLLGKLPEDTNPTFDYRLVQLTPFATIRRYEEGRVVLDLDEAKDVLALAERVVTWAAGVVGVPG